VRKVCSARAMPTPDLRKVRRRWLILRTIHRPRNSSLPNSPGTLSPTIRSPYEYLVAAGRLLTQLPDEPSRYLGGLNLLGQPLWSPSGPNGFPDTNAAWAAPEGMKLRLDIAAQASARLPDALDPRELLELAAADAASEETRHTIERAESRQQAMALLLMSPEFQRR